MSEDSIGAAWASRAVSRQRRVRGDEGRVPGGVELRPTRPPEDLHHVEHRQIDEPALLRIVHVGALAYDGVRGQVDAPRERRRAEEHAHGARGGRPARRGCDPVAACRRCEWTGRSRRVRASRGCAISPSGARISRAGHDPRTRRPLLFSLAARSRRLIAVRTVSRRACTNTMTWWPARTASRARSYVTSSMMECCRSLFFSLTPMKVCFNGTGRALRPEVKEASLGVHAKEERDVDVVGQRRGGPISAEQRLRRLDEPLRAATRLSMTAPRSSASRCTSSMMMSLADCRGPALAGAGLARDRPTSRASSRSDSPLRLRAV